MCELCETGIVCGWADLCGMLAWVDNFSIMTNKLVHDLSWELNHRLVKAFD